MVTDKSNEKKVFCVDEIVTKEQLKFHGYEPAGKGSRQGTELYYDNNNRKEILVLLPQLDESYKVCRKLLR